jgi:hypothetical protein
MKKLLTLITIASISLTVVFAADATSHDITINADVEETDLTTTLYYGESASLEITGYDLSDTGDDGVQVSGPFYIKAVGNIKSAISTYVSFDATYFQTSSGYVTTIKPVYHAFDSQEQGTYGYKSASGEYKIGENTANDANFTPALSVDAHSYCIVRDTAAWNVENMVVQPKDHDTVLEVKTYAGNHRNDVVSAFALEWETDENLPAGDYQSVVTVTYTTV